jgi:Holliday junction resolvase RusA-like endonuclease
MYQPQLMGDDPAPVASSPHPGELAFWVPGKPQVAGSKATITKNKDGSTREKPLIVDSGNRPNKRAWRADIRAAAQAAAEFAGGDWPTPDALRVIFVFVRPRPSDHLRSGRSAGQLKDWAAPIRPVKRPDALKYARAAEDALTGVLWVDDAAIVEERLHKAYGDQVGLGVYGEGMLCVVGRAGRYDGPPMVASLAVPHSAPVQ